MLNRLKDTGNIVQRAARIRKMHQHRVHYCMSYDSHNKAQLYSHMELKKGGYVVGRAHHSPPQSMTLCLPFNE